MVVVAIAFLVLCIICACKESKVTGTYKTFGVYGRITAYLSLFASLGLIMFVVSFFNETVAEERWAYLIAGLIGVVIYVIVFLKCPKFMRKKVIPALLVSSLGLCVKMCIFFIWGVWKLVGPQEMIDEDGNTVYVYDGNVYNASGENIGKVNADRTSYISNKN